MVNGKLSFELFAVRSIQTIVCHGQAMLNGACVTTQAPACVSCFDLVGPKHCFGPALRHSSILLLPRSYVSPITMPAWQHGIRTLVSLL